MTNYLISLGHTRIGFIQGPPEQQAPHDRFAGYQEALQAASLPSDPTLIASGDDHFESGLAAAITLLAAIIPAPLPFSATTMKWPRGLSRPSSRPVCEYPAIYL